MVKHALTYVFSFLLIILFGILFMDNFILPGYVGYNNEHYLPDIRGELLDKSIHDLMSLGFDTEIIISPYNKNHTPSTIIKMYPRAFTKVKEGRTIKLTVAGKQENIKIPNLINSTLRNAKIEISRKGLGIDTIQYEYDNIIKNGNITFQVPRQGKIVVSSTNMTLGVSKGTPPDYYIVPDIINLSLQRGKELISRSGLRLGDVDYEYHPDLLNNTIIEQNMTAGMRVSFPASINLQVSTDRIINK